MGSARKQYFHSERSGLFLGIELLIAGRDTLTGS
jgi:hypothetical protein